MGRIPPWCLAKNNAKARQEGSRTTTASNKRTRSRTGTASARARARERAREREEWKRATREPFSIWRNQRLDSHHPYSIFAFPSLVPYVPHPHPPSLWPGRPPQDGWSPPFCQETKQNWGRKGVIILIGKPFRWWGMRDKQAHCSGSTSDIIQTSGSLLHYGSLAPFGNSFKTSNI